MNYTALIVVSIGLFTALLLADLWSVHKKKKQDDTHIVKTRILTVHSEETTKFPKGKALRRGILGGMVAGTPWIALGVLSTDEKTTNQRVYTFLVYYDTFTKPKVETVNKDLNPKRYEFLISKLSQ